MAGFSKPPLLFQEEGKFKTRRHIIKYASGKFEIDAVQYAIQHHYEFTPSLLDIVDEGPESCLAMGPDYTAHLYAIHILSELRETRAHVPLLRLCLCPSQRIDRLFGDFIGDGFLKRALAATSGGDITGISMLIGYSYIDKAVQIAALEAMVRLVVEKRVSRYTVIECLRKLFHGMSRTPSMVWDELVDSAQKLAAWELRLEVMAACHDELTDYTWADIESELDGSWEVARFALKLLDEEPDFEHDSWWTPWNRC